MHFWLQKWILHKILAQKTYSILCFGQLCIFPFLAVKPKSNPKPCLNKESYSTKYTSCVFLLWSCMILCLQLNSKVLFKPQILGYFFGSWGHWGHWAKIIEKAPPSPPSGNEYPKGWQLSKGVKAKSKMEGNGLVALKWWNSSPYLANELMKSVTSVKYCPKRGLLRRAITHLTLVMLSFKDKIAWLLGIYHTPSGPCLAWSNIRFWQQSLLLRGCFTLFTWWSSNWNKHAFWFFPKKLVKKYHSYFAKVTQRSSVECHHRWNWWPIKILIKLDRSWSFFSQAQLVSTTTILSNFLSIHPHSRSNLWFKCHAKDSIQHHHYNLILFDILLIRQYKKACSTSHTNQEFEFGEIFYLCLRK